MTSLAKIATGRDGSLFARDLAERAELLRRGVQGKRILAIGAAGSIGSNTVMTLSRYAPKALHVVDQNENALAELIRQFRSTNRGNAIDDLRTAPLDYGSHAMERLIAEEGHYDLVLNFAAIKHVRSEKDVFSILQMLDTNIVKQARLLRWVAHHTPGARYFSVSTDKAANPSSFMGATKRIMEHVMFDPGIAEGMTGAVTSARFANVAFSNGSLLQAFESRLARGEPIACPGDIRRYFVSLEESGHICALAALALDAAQIGIPRLDPEKNLMPLREIAEAFIRHNGYEPVPYEDDVEARARAGDEIAAGRWPLVLTTGNTAGEKPYEEFVTAGEDVVSTGLHAIDAIAYTRSGSSIGPSVDRLERMVRGESCRSPVDKDAIKALIGELEPAFLQTHRDSALHLDQRM